jgi:hypothetical protein
MAASKQPTTPAIPCVSQAKLIKSYDPTSGSFLDWTISTASTTTLENACPRLAAMMSNATVSAGVLS